jgi:hypothetical protein
MPSRNETMRAAAKAKVSIADASWGTSFIVRHFLSLHTGLLNCPTIRFQLFLKSFAPPLKQR